MPQSMPLNWLILFIYFLLIFFILIIKMYYFYYPMKLTLNKFNWQKKNSWKW
uniref:ATP synthase complex subunit 8 n=1 Tax=Cycloneda sanguinea TaxID=633097 RepID=A0A1B1W5J1_9CUCU|nr:atp8 [Cycloneda sanguinea]